MITRAKTECLTVGAWRAERLTGRISRAGEARALEPRVMDLLFLLASRPGEVFSREEILERLWPAVTVGEDALARSISKLRRALGDDPAAPVYVETIPKRGYRLVAPVAADAEDPPVPGLRRRPSRMVLVSTFVLLAVVMGAALFSSGAVRRVTGATSEAQALTARAEDHYFQYTRADNEAAMELYEQAIAEDPDYAPALAGLANGIVQRVIRWPGGRDVRHRDLAEAIAAGRTSTPEARRQLARARTLAERAARLAPADPGVLRALGLVRSAQGELEGATAAYQRALARDPDAWGVLINLGDVSEMRGRDAEALAHFERAYEAMGRVYDAQSARVRPWQAELGVNIARRHAAAGRAPEAERWFRRVLAAYPFHPAATAGLAAVLTEGGDRNEARRLCRELVERTGPSEACAPWLD